jgi:hypothetical protein
MTTYIHYNIKMNIKAMDTVLNLKPSSQAHSNLETYYLLSLYICITEFKEQVLLQKGTVTKVVGKSVLILIEHDSLLPCSQKPYNQPYSEPD